MPLPEKISLSRFVPSFHNSRVQFLTMNMDEVNPENPDHLMRPDLRFQSLNDLVGRCEHATQAQCLFENLVVTHGTGESLTVQCRRCRAQ